MYSRGIMVEKGPYERFVITAVLLSAVLGLIITPLYTETDRDKLIYY